MPSDHNPRGRAMLLAGGIGAGALAGWFGLEAMPTPAAAVIAPASPAVAPPPPAAPIIPDAPGADRLSFRYCSEARAAGVAPMRRGEPGYAPHLDRDDDGVACEPYWGR